MAGCFDGFFCFGHGRNHLVGATSRRDYNYMQFIFSLATTHASNNNNSCPGSNLQLATSDQKQQLAVRSSLANGQKQR